MATVYETIQQKANESGGGRNVAGYVEDTTFHYVATKNLNLPAAAYVLDVTRDRSGGKTKVYSNLPPDHWITTYTQRALINVTVDTALKQDVTKAVEIASPKLSLIAGSRTASAPITGGLYDAALSLYNDRALVDVRLGDRESADARFQRKGPGRTGGEHDELRGKKQALRYYMLGAYALLAICNESNHGGNFIAAMMVDDQGQIVSYGVNSRGATHPWHHGEVNMLLNYFNQPGNQSKKTFEEKTLIFSTLTPCAQCAKYLQDSRPASNKAIVFIGQHDTGKLGFEGAKHGVFLHEVIKAPNWKIRTVDRGVFAKEAVHIQLARQMDPDSQIALQIGSKGKTQLLNAANTLVGKVLKSRNESAEQAVKQNVLNYLGMWLGTIDLGVKTYPKP